MKNGDFLYHDDDDYDIDNSEEDNYGETSTTKTNEMKKIMTKMAGQFNENKIPVYLHRTVYSVHGREASAVNGFVLLCFLTIEQWNQAISNQRP